MNEIERMPTREVEPVDMPTRIANEVERRATEALAADGEHDRRVQNEIARGFWKGEVVTAAQAEMAAVNDALDDALRGVLGQISQQGRTF